MGLRVDIDVSEISQLAEKLHGISVRAADITEAAPAIRLILQQDVDERFMGSPPVESGGTVVGGEYWKPLSHAYLAENPRRYGGQILRDTGELMQSLTAEGHPYNVFSVSETEVVFGTALAKAGRLQSDRPFLFWHPALIEKVANYMANYVAGN